ncbi:MAG: hypothetical protein PVH22_13575 [Desulfobacteraceae bacterium]|jgi:hypothetical protein
MKTLKKGIAALLMMSIIGLHLPNAGFCADEGQFAAIPNKTITRHKVRTMSTPEDISVEKVQKGDKKGFKWLLIGVSAALVAGLAAAGGGGGGSSSSSSSGQDDSSTDAGSVTVGW